MERDRRAALELERVPAESKVQSAAQYLCSEVDIAVCSRQMLLHGPDTVERFAEFSMSAVITEVQARLSSTVPTSTAARMHSEECERWLSTRRRAERGDDSLYSSECTVCKGEGTAVNDQSDAGRKGNRQTGTCTYMYRVCTHNYTYTQIILKSI